MPSATAPEPDAAPLRRVLEYPVPRGKVILELQGQPPGWIEPTLKALGQLLTLPPNWDSYDARPVDLANVWAAWQLLAATLRDDSPPPAVVPTNDGGVQVEWHTQGIDLEIIVATPRPWYVSFEDAQTGEAWEQEIPNDPGALAPWVARLARGS